jgi:hypothetical protein
LVLWLVGSLVSGWSQEASRSPAWARLAIAVLVGGTLTLEVVTARADGLEVYAPLEQEPVWALEVHASTIVPLERSAICPAGSSCVLGGGFGAGAYLLRRNPDGIGLLVGYEVWLLDGGGVYEIGALHSLRLGVRWTLDNRSIVQPLLQATVGAVLLTDPAQASTAGGLVAAGTGIEIELTRDVALSLTAELAFFSVAAFRTRDGADRALDFGVNVALETTAGLVVVLGSSGVR